MGADQLPQITKNKKYHKSTGNAAAGKTAEQEVAELKREVERLRMENKAQADQLSRAGSVQAMVDDSAFIPRSPIKTPMKPSSPPGTASGPRPAHLHLSTPRFEGLPEHPLNKEYKEIQESAMRWVTTDQPFVTTNRQNNGNKGINMCDNVSEDFFRHLLNQATFNLPKELRYALAMAKESQDKVSESMDVLMFSQRTVDKTSEDTAIDLQHDFELCNDRLKNKGLYFSNELAQYREETSHKIETELSIVGMLINTLQESIDQANSVLAQHADDESGADWDAGEGGKSLHEIREEYALWKRQIMPSMGGIPGKITTMMGDAAKFGIQEIIVSLLGTLQEVLSKAKHTADELRNHKDVIMTMVDATQREMDGDFVVFHEALDKKQVELAMELDTFRTETTHKIQANQGTVVKYQEVLQDHVEYSERILEKGNDYQMFRQTKEMKNQMVMMYAELSKMRLQYDGIMFQLASSDFDVPIDHIGSHFNACTKIAVDWSPTANKQRTKKKFEPDTLTMDETEVLRKLFNDADKDGSGRIEISELRSFMAQVWPWATPEKIDSVINLAMTQDDNNDGDLDFEEWLALMQSHSHNHSRPGSS